MKRIAAVLIFLTWGLNASAVEQFRIEYKIYRTSDPDEERAANRPKCAEDRPY